MRAAGSVAPFCQSPLLQGRPLPQAPAAPWPEAAAAAAVEQVVFNCRDSLLFKVLAASLAAATCADAATLQLTGLQWLLADEQLVVRRYAAAGAMQHR